MLRRLGSRRPAPRCWREVTAWVPGARPTEGAGNGRCQAARPRQGSRTQGSPRFTPASGPCGRLGSRALPSRRPVAGPRVPPRGGQAASARRAAALVSSPGGGAPLGLPSGQRPRGCEGRAEGRRGLSRSSAAAANPGTPAGTVVSPAPRQQEAGRRILGRGGGGPPGHLETQAANRFLVSAGPNY